MLVAELSEGMVLQLLNWAPTRSSSARKIAGMTSCQAGQGSERRATAKREGRRKSVRWRSTPRQRQLPHALKIAIKASSPEVMSEGEGDETIGTRLGALELDSKGLYHVSRGGGSCPGFPNRINFSNED